MGGLHGNKGAIIMRLVLDDSSLCFVNCHLAAGQTQTLHRNNDVTAILEANALPPYPLGQSSGAQHSDVFAAGGDGSMILDHEICILNGDLNYRIDTMGRDTVVKHVQQGNLARLLERDQLLLSRRKNPGFRLRAFQESPINFAPTYKYNVRTDDYDTSEKRRSPAWCDRILYRGLGKVKMEEYRRWDQLRVSDHRPVSGRLLLRVKTVDPDKREIIWNKCLKEFDGVRHRIARAAQ
jgi:endonuclease/exonuclease/phosphatase family metal-dependent hydrolase